MEKKVRVYDTTISQVVKHFESPLNEKAFAEAISLLATVGIDTVEVFGAPDCPKLSTFRWAYPCELALRTPSVEDAIRAVGETARTVSHAVMTVQFSADEKCWKRRFGIASRADAIRSIRRNLSLARNYVETVQFSIASRQDSDPIFVRQCSETGLEAGARRISLVDVSDENSDGTHFLNVLQEVRRFLGQDVFIGVASPSAHTTTQAIQCNIHQIESNVWRHNEQRTSAELTEVVKHLPEKSCGRIPFDIAKIHSLQTELLRVLSPFNTKMMPYATGTDGNENVFRRLFAPCASELHEIRLL
ncbi:MAG TPA: hypothetical protein PKY35_13640 [Candidatus Hydrogenedentes bacterium]|nr:hypothetical protein [Candidatus Hydrogenedentota bacterium]HOL78062.1 hypothetical protein [Candidatus Hydrogenedentota bacterium]HPO86916.1 hypothetical protein [Candidatus Hydrogenedentota bacterium]